MQSCVSIHRALTAIVRPLYLGIALLMLVGCKTVPPSAEAIAPFRLGVATADQQTASTFADVNTFLRRQQIERASTLDALSEDEFVAGLDAPDLASWRRAFALMSDYAEKLERLLNPARRADVEAELSQLGGTFAQVRGEQLPTGVAAGFVQLGGFLVQIRAGQDALEQIHHADPAIQQIFGAMMAAIGPDPESGVRGTVADTWSVMLARIVSQDFLRARGADAKRAAVTRFVAAMDQRDAQDQMLGALRLALASLAKAHQELAAGRPASASALIRIVQAEYQAYREHAKAVGVRSAAGAATGSTP